MSWVIGVFAVLLGVLALQLVVFERGKPAPRTLALIAAMSALAIAGRLAFAPLPNVKPTTVIVLIAGFTLGAAPGFAVGAITALVSNMFYGQGPWTPWQMFAWGLAGLIGALLARVTGGRVGRVTLAATATAAALVFGVVMDVSQWVTFSGEPKTSTLIAYMATSLPWNIAHAVGSAAFALAFGPLLIAAVKRVTERAEPKWMPRGVEISGFFLPALLAVVAAVPTVPSHGTANANPTKWLVSTQNSDGGFPSSKGASSAPMETAWSAMALAASGRDLSSVARPGGMSVVERLMADAGSAGEPNEKERLLLAASAAKVDVRSFGGRDLVAQVLALIGRDGSVGSTVNLTSFAILSLRSAGVSSSNAQLAKASGWLARQRQADGGFSFAAKGSAASDVDDTAAAAQALAAAGALSDSAATKITGYFHRSRNADGGFGQSAGGTSNAQSTAWAIQGMNAADAVGAIDDVAAAESWLRARITRSGAVDYQKGSHQTPVWVTAQAILALSGHTLFFEAPQIDRSTDSSSGGSSSGDAGAAAGDSSAQAAKKALEKAKSDAQAVEVRQAGIRVALMAEAAGRIGAALAKSFSGPTR